MSSWRCAAPARRFSSGLCTALALLTVPAVAEPDPTGRGIAGGALLGAEIAIFGEAIAGLESPWLYWAGAGLGAVGGGLGGYYVESSGAPRTSYYMLAGGMALSIPALVVYLDATNEARSAVTTEPVGPDYDEEPLDELDEARVLPLPKRAALAPIDFEGGWRLRPPSVVLSPTFTPFETAAFGLPSATQVTFPLVGGAF
jgi:hypothetical protein